MSEYSLPNVLRQSFNEHLETKSFHCQPDAVVEETGTDQPLFGEGFARNGTAIIDGFGSPECHRHECGIWVMELAEGLATEPDESLVPWVMVSLHMESCSIGLLTLDFLQLMVWGVIFELRKNRYHEKNLS